MMAHANVVVGSGADGAAHDASNEFSSSWVHFPSAGVSQGVLGVGLLIVLAWARVLYR